MNLICDEGVERQIVERLRADGHGVLYVAELAPGTSDNEILARATAVGAPLVTRDKDFGELVFRQGLATHGVILLRLKGLSATRKSEIVSSVLAARSAEIIKAFTVVSPGQVRIRPSP